MYEISVRLFNRKMQCFRFKTCNQLFWFLAASLAASLAALATLWAITRSLSICTSASRWRNISLSLLVCLSTWAASLRSLLLEMN